MGFSSHDCENPLRGSLGASPSVHSAFPPEHVAAPRVSFFGCWFGAARWSCWPCTTPPTQRAGSDATLYIFTKILIPGLVRRYSWKPLQYPRAARWTLVLLGTWDRDVDDSAVEGSFREKTFRKYEDSATGQHSQEVRGITMYCKDSDVFYSTQAFHYKERRANVPP